MLVYRAKIKENMSGEDKTKDMTSLTPNLTREFSDHDKENRTPNYQERKMKAAQNATYMVVTGMSTPILAPGFKKLVPYELEVSGSFQGDDHLSKTTLAVSSPTNIKDEELTSPKEDSSVDYFENISSITVSAACFMTCKDENEQSKDAEIEIRSTGNRSHTMYQQRNNETDVTLEINASDSEWETLPDSVSESGVIEDTQHEAGDMRVTPEPTDSDDSLWETFEDSKSELDDGTLKEKVEGRQISCSTPSTNCMSSKRQSFNLASFLSVFESLVQGPPNMVTSTPNKKGKLFEKQNLNITEIPKTDQMFEDRKSSSTEGIYEYPIQSVLEGNGDTKTVGDKERKSIGKRQVDVMPITTIKALEVDTGIGVSTFMSSHDSKKLSPLIISLRKGNAGIKTNSSVKTTFDGPGESFDDLQSNTMRKSLVNLTVEKLDTGPFCDENLGDVDATCAFQEGQGDNLQPGSANTSGGFSEIQAETSTETTSSRSFASKKQFKIAIKAAGSVAPLKPENEHSDNIQESLWWDDFGETELKDRYIAGENHHGSTLPTEDNKNKQAETYKGNKGDISCITSQDHNIANCAAFEVTDDASNRNGGGITQEEYSDTLNSSSSCYSEYVPTSESSSEDDKHDSNISTAVKKKVKVRHLQGNMEARPKKSVILEPRPKKSVILEPRPKKSVILEPRPKKSVILEPRPKKSITLQPRPKTSLILKPRPLKAYIIYKPTEVKNQNFYGDVQKTVEKMTKTLEDMPSVDGESEEIIVPPGMIDLYDHQIFGLRWLMWREQEYPGGGILGDEMGLGKTIEMIALINKTKMEMSKVNTGNWMSPDEVGNLKPSKTTLVICPVGCLAHWSTEIKKKAKGLRVYKYYGPERTTSATTLAKCDIVLTTYTVLIREAPQEDRSKRNSPLFRIYWFRVILDEAHEIRNPSTVRALATCLLEARHRWAVTGTPLHNRPEDFYSILKFLKMAPFDDLSVWDAWIGIKEVRNDDALERMKILGKSLTLRRTKEEVKVLGGNVKVIPPKQVKVVKIQLNPEERRVYDILMNDGQKMFEKWDDTPKSRKHSLPNDKSLPENISNFHIFARICRLRQCAVLPFLIHAKLENDDTENNVVDFDEENDEHVLDQLNLIFEKSFESSKIRMILKDLDALRHQASIEKRPMDKVVIVSQWTTCLDVMHQHLKRQKFTSVFITGNHTHEERSDSIDKFNNYPNKYHICLLSLKAGGVGINLTGGNHVFFMDPHWNPQLELQAQDRVHRFGQSKNVYINRYISEDTVEERILKIQEQKLVLSNGLLNATTDNTKAYRLTFEEMRYLFKQQS